LIGSTANTDVAALTDDVLTISNNHFLPGRDYDLVYAWAGSPTLDRARIVSPTNRQVTLPFIRPISAAVVPAAEARLMDLHENPFRVRGLEELAIEASAAPSATERFTCVLGLSAGFEPAPRGDIFILRGTSTTAATANVWSSIAVTWADILPAGSYAVVGLEVISTNHIASRLIVSNQRERPGAIGVTTAGNRQYHLFRSGNLGVWGRFRSTEMPIVQVLANAADATHTVYLSIIRTG
jgi:hypothetical protein